MKKVIFFLLILNHAFSYGQVEIPFFEQIAFDFYKDTILKKHPIKKRITIFKYTMDVHPPLSKFQINSCLTGEILTEGKELNILGTYALEQMDFDSPTQVMKYSNLNKKQFRIKKSNHNKTYPIIHISQPFHRENNYNEYFVSIILSYKKESVEYDLLIDNNGKIINWCSSKSELITIY